MTDTIQEQRSSSGKQSLQERLRNFPIARDAYPGILLNEAADEIDSLQESNTSLREEIDRLNQRIEELKAELEDADEWGR